MDHPESFEPLLSAEEAAHHFTDARENTSALSEGSAHTLCPNG
jgi:hypothetical protein